MDAQQEGEQKEEKIKQKEREFSVIMTDMDDMGKKVGMVCISFH